MARVVGIGKQSFEKIIKENNVIKYFLVFIEDSLKRI